MLRPETGLQSPHGQRDPRLSCPEEEPAVLPGACAVNTKRGFEAAPSSDEAGGRAEPRLLRCLFLSSEH